MTTSIEDRTGIVTEEISPQELVGNAKAHIELCKKMGTHGVTSRHLEAVTAVLSALTVTDAKPIPVYYCTDCENRIPRLVNDRCPCGSGRVVVSTHTAKTADDAAKFELWFFRDLSDEQRLKLFALYGLPVEEIGHVHGRQKPVLRRIMRALTTTASPANQSIREMEEKIERLRVGIKRLSDEEEMCAETTGDDPFSLVYLASKLANAEGEIDRLREALDTIATSFHGSNPSMAYADAPREDYLDHVLMEARRFARAALLPQGQGEGK